MIEHIAEVAAEEGLLGEGYFWIFSGDAFPRAVRESMKYPKDSNVDKLLRGAAFFTNYDQFNYNSRDDVFLKTWKKQGYSLVEQLNTMQPPESTFVAESDYFQTVTPTEYSSFLYDSVVATGLSACEAAQGSHYDKLLLTSFQGASGRVQFAENKNSREPLDMMYGVYNIRPGALHEGNMQRYVRIVAERIGVTHFLLFVPATM